MNVPGRKSNCGQRNSVRLPYILPLALAVHLSVCTVARNAERPGFTDVTEASGVAQLVTEHYGAWPDWWLSGLHLVDLDGDSDLDLFLSSHGRGRNLALRNDGKGCFTRAAGSCPPGEIHLCYDSDEDGMIDLTMTWQDGGGRWWLNRSKPDELSFEPTDLTRGTNTARRQAMIDINGDGNVDWLRGTDSGIEFDFGNGSGAFGKAGDTLPVTKGRDEVLCLPSDIDNDGDIDLLTEWGHYTSHDGNSRIYQNDGVMTFEDVTAHAGITGTGTAIKGVGDVDQDGDADLICLENRRDFEIYLNDGAGRFTKKDGAIHGISKGGAYASWGVAVTTDFDNDGTVDILINGKNFLKILRGSGGGSFEYANEVWGIADISASSIDDGLCFGDIDSDGDLDILGYTSIDGQRRFAVYRNDVAAGNWLRIRLVGSQGNRGAAGAKIRVYRHGENRLLWYEQVAIYDSQAAPSYYAMPVTERHFGLGKLKAVDVSIEFYPSQRLVWKRGVNANQAVEICEQSATASGDHPDPNRLARIRAAKMPTITAPVMFNTPEADAILSALEVFPPDNPWNLVVSDWPLHPNSNNIIASIGLDKSLRYNPDMCFVLVPSEQRTADVRILSYPDESDKGPFPVPDNMPIEGWPVYYQRDGRHSDLTLQDVQRDKLGLGGDRHGIVVDPMNRVLYEFYAARRTDRGWQAAQASVFDLKTNRLRPAGWTSADAAGLPIFPAVVRYDELKRGIVEHAMRVTIRKTRRAYVAPATHFASRYENEEYPRMGERLRLRQDYDISGFSPEVQAILKGLKRYGMLVADNGIEWAISVAPDPRIPNLHEELRRVKGSDFEVVVTPE